MEFIKIENLSFCYPNKKRNAVDNLSLSVRHGEFITVCGKSGCGKTTLLRLMKPALSPHGKKSGDVIISGKSVYEYTPEEQSSKIGFVMQDPDNQIVTDMVWHELAFGLESLGFSTPEIRVRVSEMASFFGIQNWFYKKVNELSGGQKQLLNLASVMVMQPEIIILDEPTSQLDPIAAHDFIKTLEKINRELNVTVILSEHRLEEAFPVSDRIVVIDKGKIIADDSPANIGKKLVSENSDMYFALPVPIRVHQSVENNLECPVTIRDGRIWLENIIKEKTPDIKTIPAYEYQKKEIVIDIKDVWFRYEKNSPDVLKGLNLEIEKGELFAIAGGNGTGKTTALSIISSLNKPYRGNISIFGKDLLKGNSEGVVGVLPQNPRSIFMKKTVFLDLMEVLSEEKIPEEDKLEKIRKISEVCRIENHLEDHPYDLSGGEQQRAALAKVLLKSPKILLLDEPTKGLGAHFKMIFAEIIKELKNNGATIVMVSHDIEFCAEYADRCALFFDGNITSIGTPGEFFRGKNFYTTSANRMARTTIPEAILAEDIIKAFGGEVKKAKLLNTDIFSLNYKDEQEEKSVKKKKKISPIRKFTGVVFSVLFILCTVLYMGAFERIVALKDEYIRIFGAVCIAGMFFSFVDGRSYDRFECKYVKKDKNSKSGFIAALLILFAIPVTIYGGIKLFGDRKYYFISLLIIFETIIPFCMVFEKRKPKARELVVISVLCAIAVAGRAVFYMFPQFKPVIPIVIIAGICFGGETGFLVGAVTGFVSNFLFGQGPWTPWQMFAFGIIGFLSGVIFCNEWIEKTRLSLCAFAFVATLVIYGGIMNPASVIMWQGKINYEMLISAYAVGLPFDIIHALAAAFFVWFISEPMVEKLERIKIKYGLIED